VVYVELMYENEGGRKVDVIHQELVKLTGGNCPLDELFVVRRVSGGGCHTEYCTVHTY
jgi:hypothetical protein